MDLWIRERELWHHNHQVDGRSELGDFVDLARARQAARLMAVHTAPGMAVPLPSVWARRWGERPEWWRAAERAYVPSLRSAR